MSNETLTVDGHEIELSNLDKVLFPDSGLTKADLVDYYRRIAEVALVHYRDRPLTMERFPDGIGEEGFIQKDAPDYFPDWIERAELKKAGGTVSSVIANNAATLVYLANQGCITPHLGLSRIDQVDKPDRLMFDLDPSVDDFAKVQAAARWLRELLESLEITSFVQTTGSRGLHVVVPLERSAGFDEIRKCAARLADVLARQHPEDLTVAGNVLVGHGAGFRPGLIEGAKVTASEPREGDQIELFVFVEAANSLISINRVNIGATRPATRVRRSGRPRPPGRSSP
jgi:bifunctional non-homologous end joining protein LigD